MVSKTAQQLHNKVILRLNMTFGQELVALRTTFSTFEKFLVHALVWRFEQTTIHIGLLRVKLILACQNGHTMSLAPNEPHEIGYSSFKLKHYFQACATSGKNY
jgi:hypothetical protein